MKIQVAVSLLSPLPLTFFMKVTAAVRVFRCAVGSLSAAAMMTFLVSFPAVLAS